MNDDEDKPIPRITTGVPGLDLLLGGGILVGGMYLVIGRPGAGKTTLANQIAFHHTARGGRAVYVTLLTESHGRMLALMESMAFFRPDAVGASLHYLSGYKALESGKLLGLLQTLRAAVRDHEATLLVVDGLLSACDLGEPDIEIKKFMHELEAVGQLTGCTIVVLRGATDENANYPERTMADGLVVLTMRRSGIRAYREIEVQKHRGSAHLLGASVFQLTSEGIHVFPRTEARYGIDMAGVPSGPDERLPVGIPALDAMLNGGLPARSTTILLGSPGVGKTLLGLRFLQTGAQAKEPALYFGFNEPPDRILTKARGIGIDLQPSLESGMFTTRWHPPQEPLSDRLVEVLVDQIKRTGVRRVFIDGIEGLTAGLVYPERLRAFSTSLNNELATLGVTAMMSEVIADLFGPEFTLPPGPAQAVDNVIFMRQVELRSQIRRLISVLKMRDSGYESSLREFAIGDSGFDVAQTFESAEAILSGIARPSSLRPSVPGPPRSRAKRSRRPSKRRPRGKG